MSRNDAVNLKHWDLLGDGDQIMAYTGQRWTIHVVTEITPDAGHPDYYTTKAKTICGIAIPRSEYSLADVETFNPDHCPRCHAGR